MHTMGSQLEELDSVPRQLQLRLSSVVRKQNYVLYRDDVGDSCDSKLTEMTKKKAGLWELSE